MDGLLLDRIGNPSKNRLNEKEVRQTLIERNSGLPRAFRGILQKVCEVPQTAPKEMQNLYIVLKKTSAADGKEKV